MTTIKSECGPKLPEAEWERIENSLDLRLYALEAIAAEQPAHSLVGAMVAIVLAHREAGCLTEEDDPVAAKFGTVSKLLYGALVAIEEATGIQREEIGGGAYMRRSLDPNRLI